MTNTYHGFVDNWLKYKDVYHKNEELLAIDDEDEKQTGSQN
jgi:hypothetical protein